MSMFSFSLCPGGAMMLCEDASEYDANLPERLVSPAVVEETRAALTPQAQSYDPVDRLIIKMGPKYTLLKSILGREYPDNAEGMVGLVEEISATASELADCIRSCLVKLQAMARLITDDCNWTYEPVAADLGWFMKNAGRLRREGYDRLDWSYGRLDGFWGYEIGKMLTLYIKAQSELPATPFELRNMREALGIDGSCRAAIQFESTLDMFNCLFENPERRIRLERAENRSLVLDEILNSCGGRPYACDTVSNRQGFDCALIEYVSVTLRQVKRCSYDLMCELIDGQGTMEDHIECVRHLQAGLANIFFVPMFYMFYMAYDMRGDLYLRNALVDFVKVAHNALPS